MLFDIHGLKQVNQNESVQFDLLIEVDSEDDLKDISNQVGLILLSYKIFSGDKNTYGETFFKFEYRGKEHEVITKYSSLDELYTFATEKLLLNVIYMNSFVNPIQESKILETIKNLKEAKNQKKEQEKEAKSKSSSQNDKLIIKMKDLMTQSIEEGNKLLAQLEGNVPLEMIRRFTNGIDELKKFRISNNIEKMAEAYEGIIKLMEEAEMALIEKDKTNESTQLKDFMISDLDIVREYQKFKKSKLAIKGSKVSSTIKLDNDTKFYSSFGQFGVYIRLFAKEISKKLKNKDFEKFNIFEISEIFLGFVLIELGIFLTMSKFIDFKTYENTAYYYISFFGLLGLILFFVQKFKRQNAVINIILLICGLIMFGILRYLAIMIFAI